MSYVRHPDKFILDNVVSPFLQLSVVTVISTSAKSTVVNIHCSIYTKFTGSVLKFTLKLKMEIHFIYAENRC